LAEQTKANVRAATRMLILIVSCYLGANVVNVIITFWEFISNDTLKQYPMFYTMGADVVSLLTVGAAAARLPIYCSCNVQVS
jgi:hypothetical protein